MKTHLPQNLKYAKYKNSSNLIVIGHQPSLNSCLLTLLPKTFIKKLLNNIILKKFVFYKI